MQIISYKDRRKNNFHVIELNILCPLFENTDVLFLIIVIPGAIPSYRLMKNNVCLNILI
jgi:hypothetical protein